jgi:putative hydrolase of the HAD superfamily
MPIRAVIFDVYGTLTPSTPAHVWHEHATRTSAVLGIAGDVWQAELDASFQERATGALGDLPQTIRTLAARCGVEPGEETLAEACAVRTLGQRRLFALRDDALATLAGVRARGLPVGLLSDCTIELAEAWPTLPQAALVDAAVFSCDAGRCKPDPVLFRLIAERLGVAPAECLYVGDGGGHELTGATRAGMTAYMLKAADWADNHFHSREDDWAGPFLPSLSAVLDLLGPLPDEDRRAAPAV